MAKTEPVLRKSLFIGVPPFINFVPGGGFPGEVIRGPQYWDHDNWDQDQLWRVALAMARWIEECCVSQETSTEMANYESSNTRILTNGCETLTRRQVRSKRKSTLIGNPFEQRAEDAKIFSGYHVGVKLCQFPKMRHISRKDLLGKQFSLMQKRYGTKDFSFHPMTYVLPEDYKNLVKIMAASTTPESDLWIVKPPAGNNGHGVHVINGNAFWNGALTEDTNECCVQQYIRDPLLIRGAKFDIRIYVLLTSLDPLKIYMYDDGLVRIATELYTEDPASISESCIHVTNYDVNRRNTEKFIYNNNVSGYEGHKWRLRMLWQHLGECGYQDYHLEYIWQQIEDAVIKTILVALPEMRKEFHEMETISAYNTYKILGYDMLIDKDLKVHVIEVNGRPQLQNAIIDKAVNRPMLSELLKIVGFHIPTTAANYRQFIADKFDLGPDYGVNGHSIMYPVTHNFRVYTKVEDNEDTIKQKLYNSCTTDRHSYLDNILEELAPNDVRTLIKAEEELNQTSHFTRLFPSPTSHKYFQYFYEGIPYYDKLLDAWEFKYHDQRSKAIRRLKMLCAKAVFNNRSKEIKHRI